jgi:hypothetical protein
LILIGADEIRKVIKEVTSNIIDFNDEEGRMEVPNEMSEERQNILIPTLIEKSICFMRMERSLCSQH